MRSVIPMHQDYLVDSTYTGYNNITIESNKNEPKSSSCLSSYWENCNFRMSEICIQRCEIFFDIFFSYILKILFPQKDHITFFFFNF